VNTTTIGAPAAGIGRRLASLLYEGLLLAGIVGVLALLLTAFSALLQRPVPIATIRVVVFLALAIYFLWHWQDGRQTLPMRTWHLHLVDRQGRPPALIRLAWRYVLAWPSIGLGLGLLWALIDRDRQFLHDRLAGTRLIYVPPTRAAAPPPAGTGRWASPPPSGASSSRSRRDGKTGR
jgi:uncharacterized RDD family membrane protein YckC